MEPADGAKTVVRKQSLVRCLDWLQKQNSLEPKKLSLQNKNDIQFIIQTNADRKKFLLSAAEDDSATVPEGVGEPEAKPKKVSLRKLRVEQLHMACDWLSCDWVYSNYDGFQKHVQTHFADIKVIEGSGVDNQYACLWNICGFKTANFNEMLRHINYHAYHTHLMAIGFNGRATLDLARCTKDSTKRNILPPLPCDHSCMWTDCERKYNSIQSLFDHVKLHVFYSDSFVCSWGGCGASFPRRALLTMHVRSHTGERLIACYHCGKHFANNVKLSNHLKRQNVPPGSSYQCGVCLAACASDYLLREHARQHVSAYACSLCDMSATTPAALATHVRYRHMKEDEKTRPHACTLCDYRTIMKSDLIKHIATHKGKHSRKRKGKTKDSDDSTDEDLSEELPTKKKKANKKYACHMCPEKEMKIFARGTKLTTHLVKMHGAQWPFGHSRFRYQISEDGMYRLTTTRYEILEVSKKIVDGTSGPKELINTDFEFEVKKVAEATKTTPRHFEVVLKGTENDCDDKDSVIKIKEEDVKSDGVEIEMCDVDEQGNVISKEIFKSDVVYS